MKTSIFTLILIATSTLFVNAAELDLLDTHLLDNNKTPKEKVDNPKIYQWTVKTTTGVFTGTADNLEEANSQIATLSKTASIINKNITSINLNHPQNADRIYTWGVITDRGYATGVATSISQATTMVKLMGDLEVPKTKIIESFKSNK